jgi:hypothetical protein
MSKRRETAQRIERLLDEHGFIGAIGLLAKPVADALQREDKLLVLQKFERDMQAYVKEAMQCYREIKLDLIDALANDERGNVNERANAKAKADKIRGEVQ